MKRFYVNSWGRDKKQIITIRAVEESAARILCTAEENSISEITEVAHSEADSLQDFCLVIAAFNKAIRPWDVHGIEDLGKPVAICFGTIVELRQIHDFHSKKLVNKLLLALN